LSAKPEDGFARETMLSLDHITISALTLEAGVAHVRQALGVDIPFGGVHRSMGTHNHLMRLAKDVFLEVIAPDPENQPQRPRWFALDDPHMRARLQSSPRLITWVVRTDDIVRSLNSTPAVVAEPVRVSRGSLSWLFSLSSDGRMPFDGAFPAIIQWPLGPLPSSSMADLGCQLKQLEIWHPDAQHIKDALGQDFVDDRVTLRAGDDVRLVATISTPSGIRQLT
jgi:hypothetical protein